MGQKTARPVSTMGDRLSCRQALFFFLFIGFAAGQEPWGDYFSGKISFPICEQDDTCPVYYYGDTLHVNYTLGNSRRLERLVMSLMCMAMEDDDPPTRSLVLGDNALTVFSVEDDPDSWDGGVPLPIPAIPQLSNISPEIETAATLACVIRLKGERFPGCPPVNLQSDPFQLRAASRRDEHTANRKRLGAEQDFPWRFHPTMMGSTAYGHRPTFASFTGFMGPAPSIPSFITTTCITTATLQADPTTLVLPPEATSETDKRAPEGYHKAAVGIGVGAALAALVVGLMTFFPLRRRFRRWRWRRLDAKAHPRGGRPAWIIDQSGAVFQGGNQRQPGMTQDHANPVNMVHELHGNSRPVAELSGVPVQRAQLRRENGHERRDGRQEREEPDENEVRSVERQEGRAADIPQKRVEQVVEERSDGRTEGGIEDSTEERTEVMTEEVTADRVEDKAEEDVGVETENDANDEMTKQDEEREKEKKIHGPFKPS